MRSSARILVLGLAGVGLTWTVAAQTTTNATCISNLWTFNHENQSPCLVASALEGACNAGKWLVTPLTVGSEYAGALAGQSNVCQCSTVVFSMFAGCGACQNGSIADWKQWIVNCNQADISVAKYPLAIPSGYNVPTWAYLDVTLTGVWDITAAFNNNSAGSPDLSAGLPTSTIASLSTSSFPSTSVPTITPAPSMSTAATHTTNTGAISGGVVGGVVALGLLGIAALVFYRRRNRARIEAPSSHMAGEKIDFGGATTPAPIPTLGYGVTKTEQPPKLYDPDDPSTFPATPPPMFPGYTAVASSPVLSGQFSPTSGSYSPTSGQHGRTLSTETMTTNSGHQGYNGTPEI